MFDLTLASGPLRPLAAQLEASGVDSGRFFRQRGIDAAVLAERDARVPVHRLIGIWERAAEESGDAHFGLHAAARLAPSELGLVGDLCAASATLGDALEQLTRYLRVVTETVVLRLRKDGPIVAMDATFRMPPFAQGRQVAEFTVAALVHFARTVTDRPLVIRQAAFRHRGASPLEAYRAVFGAPVRFEAAQTGIELDAAVLRTGLEARDPRRRTALDAAARHGLAACPRSGRVGEQVARIVMGELRLGREPGVDAAARELATSPRSLQRSLRGEGTSFAEVVDRLRRELAIHHLADTELSMAELAFVLGFSETASFYRAFKRWTGTTPIEHRRRSR